MADSIVRTRNTRAGDARKIDEWTVKMPGGQSAKFDVLLTYGEDGARFKLKSEHPSFKKLTLAHPDLSALQHLLDERAREMIANELSDDWAPARKLEVDREALTRRTGEIDFQLNIRLKDVDYMPGHVIGNRGETPIRDEWSQSIAVQRSHLDDFSDIRPTSGLLTDPSVQEYMSSPLRNEDGSSVTRTILPGRGDDVIEMIEMLNRFSDILASRLAPGMVTQYGLPRPEDLVDLMEKAVEAGPKAIDGPRTTFKM